MEIAEKIKIAQDTGMQSGEVDLGPPQTGWAR